MMWKGNLRSSPPLAHFTRVFRWSSLVSRSTESCLASLSNHHIRVIRTQFCDKKSSQVKIWLYPQKSIYQNVSDHSKKIQRILWRSGLNFRAKHTVTILLVLDFFLPFGQRKNIKEKLQSWHLLFYLQNLLNYLNDTIWNWVGRKKGSRRIVNLQAINTISLTCFRLIWA